MSRSGLSGRKSYSESSADCLGPDSSDTRCSCLRRICMRKHAEKSDVALLIGTLQPSSLLLDIRYTEFTGLAG